MIRRVLILHNQYRSDAPSGENRVVDQDIRDLIAAGVEVSAHLPSSDSLIGANLRARATTAFSLAHNKAAAATVSNLLARSAYDIVHLHNPYPLLTTSVIRAAADRGVAVVQTVHNYRHGCMRGDHFRDGRICVDCTQGGSDLPGVVHGCYRGSRPQSALLAVARRRSAADWALVDGYIVLHDFMRNYLRTSLGIDAARVYVRPTAAPPGDVVPPDAPRSGVAYLGRLVEEKGVLELLAAWKSDGPHRSESLVLAGDGPLRRAVVEAAAEDPTITYLGVLDGPDTHKLMRSVRAVAVPSRWYEGFPRVVAEAFAVGTPVLASNVGGLPDVVPGNCGWIAAPTRLGLVEGLSRVLSADIGAYSSACRAHHAQALTPDAGIRALTAIYEDVLSRRAA